MRIIGGTAALVVALSVLLPDAARSMQIAPERGAPSPFHASKVFILPATDLTIAAQERRSGPPQGVPWRRPKVQAPPSTPPATQPLVKNPPDGLVSAFERIAGLQTGPHRRNVVPDPDGLTPVPVPPSLSLVAAGIVALAFLRRGRRA